MSAPGLPPTGRAAAEGELLAQLGLPPSAAPEDVDKLHQAASEYLASAPASLRGWAHAQAAALDAAYLQLTDPGGFGGSALRSSSRPPAVVPGGPATPPARRGSRPAAAPAFVAASRAEADEYDEDDQDDEADADALYASVTPSAHSDMGPDARRKRRRSKPLPGAVRVRPAPTYGEASGGPWKKIVLGAAGLAVAGAVLFAVYQFGGGGAVNAGNGTNAQASAGPSAPAVDMAKIATLMTKLQANPQDITTLQALGDEYYAGQQYTQAGGFYDKILAIDANNVKALLAKGAVAFNAGDYAAAQTTWQKVVTLDPKNQEVYYDLGFLYLNQASPDWTGVQTEWSKVIALDPTTQLAQLVQQHLDSLVKASMIPAPSASAGASPAASGSPAASAAPSGSPAASPAASVPAASAAASPAASTAP